MSNSIIDAYENMYGKKNTVVQVNEAVSQDRPKLSRKQRRRKKRFEESTHDKPGKIHLGSIIGKQGEDYAGRVGEIIAAVYARDWEKIERYDQSGWLDPHSFEEFNIHPDDVLVAFDIDGDIEVYTLGGGGVEIINESIRKENKEDFIKQINKPIKEHKMKSKNKFDELYSKAINEQLDAEVGFEQPEAGEMTGEIGDVFGDEESQVTVTLDRDVAQKLCEAIQAVMSDEEEEVSASGTDDFGDEAGFENDISEEGAGEDSLSTAPDGVSTQTGSHKVKSHQDIGKMTHQKNPNKHTAPKK